MESELIRSQERGNAIGPEGTCTEMNQVVVLNWQWWWYAARGNRSTKLYCEIAVERGYARTKIVVEEVVASEEGSAVT